MGQPARLVDDPVDDEPLIDWDVAVATARRLVPAGPSVPREEAESTVHRLREHAVTAEGHVRSLTGLDDGHPPRPADVVDRPGWIGAAADGLRAMIPARMPVRSGPRAARRIAARTAGAQTGVALAFLGSRVLGQYDPFGGPEAAPGRLLLVAPNIVAVQRALDVPAEDFRMWVCLHEVTHRLQFNAVPWLREHFAGEVRAFLAGAGDPDTLVGMLGRLPEALRAARRDRVRDSIGLLALLQAPEQQAALDRLLALATLLEGHADHVMDAVGPPVVPSVERIRRRFTARRQGGGLAERLLRALLGMDAKLRQYAEGAAFTRHVVDAVGMDGFNAVWTSPQTLPSRAEIVDPAAWLRRVP
ncbi:MAG: zinc-dependent metalloprotease [Pseudonocardiaceae bacterium]